MILNGHLLRIWQTCTRRYRLESKYRYLLMLPNILFSAVMRRAVVELSSGTDPHHVTTRAINTFITQVKQPGIDVPEGIDTYVLAMDYVAAIRTIIEYLTRITLLPLQLSTPTPIRPGLDWNLLATRDETGVLHRWKFVDYINDDAVIKEAHSWEVFGDMAIAEAPMVLHLISIGRREGSHRVSPWCRTYKSPAMQFYKFRKQAGGPLTDSWKPVWFSENPDNDPAVWVDLMTDDKLFEDSGLIQHIDLKQISEVHVKEFYRTLEFMSRQIESVSEVKWYDMPMSRPACDVPYTCPHQPLCYSLDLQKSLRESGLYKPGRNEIPTF